MSVNKKFWALSAVFSLILLSVFSVSVVASDTDEPDTDVTFVTKDDGTDKRYCEEGKVYVNFYGDDIVVNFYSEDTQSNLKKVEYIRSKLDGYWKDGQGFDSDVSKEDEWYSDTDDEWPNGEYRVCGRAKDMASPPNQENEGLTVEKVSEDDCCELCIDREEPGQVENVVHVDENMCGSNDIEYDEDDIGFEWDKATDKGCADIGYYEVEIYEETEGLMDTVNNGLNTQCDISEGDLTKGNLYYIKVSAVDKAGNKGESVESVHVMYDPDNPSTSFLDYPTGWQKEDFEVEVKFEDELSGLCNCSIRVKDLGTSEEKTDPVTCYCNSEVQTIYTVKIGEGEICSSEGKEKCEVRLYATDKAGNKVWQTYKKFDIDTNPPTTTKIVGEPKYFYGEPNDWWIKPWTNFSLECYDTGSGCQFTYYNIDGGDFMVYEGGFNLEGYEAGVHVICYYSTDNIDNTEEQVCEFDYIDLIDPTIEKSEDILYEEAHDFNLSGKPEYVIGGEESVLIWKEENLWKLRWTDDWSNYLWSNVIIKIITGSNIEHFKEYQFEGNQEHPDDYSQVGQQTIYVDSWVDNQEDGIEFSQEDDSALVGFEIYYNGVLDSNKVFLGGERANPEKNPFMINTNRYVSDSTLFTLNADDEGSGLSNSYYRIDETCHWETYVAPFNLSGHYEGIHEIEYYAEDNLKQLSEIKKQIVILDKTAPEIKILNPTPEETKVEKCVQSIVAIVTDEGSGIKRVWAELYDDEGLVDSVDMELTVYGTYEALMDKALPAGEYTLIVHAEDNVENSAKEEIFETLTPGVFVEYIEDPICVINPETGGECDFIFHICMRESDSVKMWMDKLGDVVTPAMMNAEISNTEGSAYVGLLDEGIDAGLLSYGEEINGRTNFKLHLDVPSDVASMIGAGSHTLDYLIESYLE